MSNPHEWAFTPNHDEVFIQWQFDQPEVFKQFSVLCDSNLSQGYSKAEFIQTNHKTALFKGYLDTTVPKDGRVQHSGFASFLSKRKHKAFYRRDYYNLWSRFTHLILKVRGDGRIYLLNLGTPGSFDITSHDVYNYPLYTHGGPYWQYEKIPFSKFYCSVHARIQDRQSPVTGEKRKADKNNRISSFGVTLIDHNDGPFELELAWVGVYNDATHFEEFAYEMYDYPINID
ncbi:unnamed protein product [Soboliphyme baturini]|uniref:CIA30 domain-containing protein n=1 Tax=Soboliphyme baturini TaxID=241478 RepID=A0A183IN80_9BILA|nr:unnamed protein product [Soboliphyme baturini]